MVLKQLLAGTALAAAATFAVAHGAYAMPYATAQNVVTNVSITGSTSLIIATSSAVFGSDTAQFDGVAPSGFTRTGVVDALVDAPEATSGPGPIFPGQNVFVPMAGASLGMIGARGDSLITAGHAGTVTASNVAEARGNAVGSAGGSNTESINFTATLTKPGKITISFNDAIFLDSATAFSGEAASSFIHNDLTITDSSGNLVFEFTPRGGPGSIFGGTATSDPFNLQANTGSVDGNPANNQIQNSGFFSATTNSALAPGQYNIQVSSSATAFIRAPEPASFALLGAGLIGLGLVRRRRG